MLAVATVLFYPVLARGSLFGQPLHAIVGLGCNIGAFVGGVVSGSTHGWVWLVAALVGNAVGLGLRPLFGLKRLGQP